MAKSIFIPCSPFFIALLSSSGYLVADFLPGTPECGHGSIPGAGPAAIDRNRGEKREGLRTISLSVIYIEWEDGPLSET